MSSRRRGTRASAADEALGTALRDEPHVRQRPVPLLNPVTREVFMSSRVTISATAIVFSSAVMVFAQASNPTQTFVNTAAQGGEAEVSLARTAETHTTNPQVKALASKIRDDHEKANAELKDLCERKHMRSEER